MTTDGQSAEAPKVAAAMALAHDWLLLDLETTQDGKRITKIGAVGGRGLSTVSA